MLCSVIHLGTGISSTTVLQSMKLGVDVNRHKEVIVKAISAVLLLLLKHFKLNHVYQVPMGSVCLPVCWATAPNSAVPLAPKSRAWLLSPLELCMSVLQPRLFVCGKTESQLPRGVLTFLLLVSV